MAVLSPNSDLKSYVKDSPVTSGIIVINTLFLIATLLSGGFDAYTLLDLGGLYPPYVTDNHEYYRLLTTIFLHGSIMHFLANMIIGVYVLSGGLEKLIGSFKFALLYFISGIGASVVIVFVTSSLTIGASGAIFGVLGGYLYIVLNKGDMINSVDRQSLIGLIAMNILFTFIMPGISIPGHIGGLAIGFLLSFVLNFHKKDTDEGEYYSF